MPDQTCNTPGCEGDPTAPGAAKGDCPRCYQRARRKLPRVAAPAYSDDRTEKITVRLTRANRRAAEKLARGLKTKLAPMLEALLSAKTGVR